MNFKYLIPYFTAPNKDEQVSEVECKNFLQKHLFGWLKEAMQAICKPTSANDVTVEHKKQIAQLTSRLAEAVEGLRQPDMKEIFAQLCNLQVALRPLCKGIAGVKPASPAEVTDAMSYLKQLEGKSPLLALVFHTPIGDAITSCVTKLNDSNAHDATAQQQFDGTAMRVEAARKDPSWTPTQGDLQGDVSELQGAVQKWSDLSLELKAPKVIEVTNSVIVLLQRDATQVFKEASAFIHEAVTEHMTRTGPSAVSANAASVKEEPTQDIPSATGSDGKGGAAAEVGGWLGGEQTVSDIDAAATNISSVPETAIGVSTCADGEALADEYETSAPETAEAEGNAAMAIDSSSSLFDKVSTSQFAKDSFQTCQSMELRLDAIEKTEVAVAKYIEELTERLTAIGKGELLQGIVKLGSLRKVCELFRSCVSNLCTLTSLLRDDIFQHPNFKAEVEAWLQWTDGRKDPENDEVPDMPLLQMWLDTDLAAATIELTLKDADQKYPQNKDVEDSLLHAVNALGVLLRSEYIKANKSRLHSCIGLGLRRVMRSSLLGFEKVLDDTMIGRLFDEGVPLPDVLQRMLADQSPDGVPVIEYITTELSEQIISNGIVMQSSASHLLKELLEQIKPEACCDRANPLDRKTTDDGGRTDGRTITNDDGRRRMTADDDGRRRTTTDDDGRRRGGD